MQFFMGLNDSYEQSRNQILLSDSLPSVDKAYSMILKVESHRQMVNSYTKSVESIALQAQSQGYRKDQRKNDKRKRHCNYSNQDGHVKDTCFKLNGYPDWCKGRRNSQGTNSASITSVGSQQLQQLKSTPQNAHNRFVTAYVAETPLEREVSASTDRIEEISALLGNLQQEVQHSLKGKSSVVASAVSQHLSPGQFNSHFVGISALSSVNCVYTYLDHVWIIDTGGH
ncbi:uncharacterized protein LOC110664358 [Hevea brasiliensis]|uniref:uncharacterized protein LOC110664358 n=1 Tax=Hevea brasiliensis TaxID=3981 RepID=UPI0025E3098F|nr:uncharacterized protein LOC110664358 [Hevea brasiliensis]